MREKLSMKTATNKKDGGIKMANVIVLFEVKPTKEGMQKYLDLAAMLK